MVCKAFLESLESSNLFRTIMNSLTALQEDLFYLFSPEKWPFKGRPDGRLAKTLLPCRLQGNGTTIENSVLPVHFTR